MGFCELGTGYTMETSPSSLSVSTDGGVHRLPPPPKCVRNSPESGSANLSISKIWFVTILPSFVELKSNSIG